MSFKNKDIIIISFLVLCVGGYWLYYAANRGVWFDELDWTLGFLYNKSLYKTIQELLHYGYNLPLFYVLLKPFYYYSQNLYILFFPSVLCSMLGVIFLYKTGRKLYGKLFAIILFTVTIISPLICYEIAAQIRPYGLLFFLSVLTLYAYICRLETENKKTIFLYGLVLTCYLYTHWFASLMIMTYALTDFYLWIKRKIKFRCIVSYLMSGCIFLPWVIFVFFCHQTSFQDYWGARIPNIEMLLDCFAYLIGYNTFLFLIFLLTFIRCFLSFILGIRNDEKHMLDWPLQFLFTCLFILFSVWIYTLALPNASLFVFRYFKVFLPQLLLLVSWGIWTILQLRLNLVAFFFLKKIPFRYIRYNCLIGIIFFIAYLVITHMTHFKSVASNNFYGIKEIPQLLSQRKSNEKTLLLSLNSVFFYTFFNISEIKNIDVAVADDLTNRNNHFSVYYVVKDEIYLNNYLKKDFSSLLQYDSIYIIPDVPLHFWLNHYITNNLICEHHKVFEEQDRIIRVCHPKVNN